HPAAPGRLEAESFRSVVVGGDVLLAVTAPDADGRPRHLLTDGEARPLPHLSYSRESGMGRILEAVRAARPLPGALDTVFTSHLAAVLRTLARDGRGVAWLPESLIAEDLARGSLVRAGVPAGDERWTVPVQIRLVRPRARQSKAAETFWTLAVEAALWRNAESAAEPAAPVARAESTIEEEL
uniref:LysR substrate-binding domain-containing protein n=1 Tax=Methylobacterium sp. B34 TaxID=95563 RepID=UPI0005B29980